MEHRRTLASLTLSMALFLFQCSDSSTGASDLAGSAASDGGIGIMSAFRSSPAAINCGQTIAQLRQANAAEVTVGNTSLFVGYVQASGTNQNPIVIRFDNGAQTFCRQHETQAPDGRAYGLSWNGGDKLYVVYTVVGGGTDLDAAGQGGWLSSYGNGGGPAVSFLGRVDPVSGQLLGGTFVSALLASGKINTLTPNAAPDILSDGSIVFHGSSAFSPRNPDRTAMANCAYPMDDYRAIFSSDLSMMSCASIKNCMALKPCP